MHPKFSRETEFNSETFDSLTQQSALKELAVSGGCSGVVLPAEDRRLQHPSRTLGRRLAMSTIGKRTVSLRGNSLVDPGFPGGVESSAL